MKKDLETIKKELNTAFDLWMKKCGYSYETRITNKGNTLFLFTEQSNVFTTSAIEIIQQIIGEYGCVVTKENKVVLMFER